MGGLFLCDHPSRCKRNPTENGSSNHMPVLESLIEKLETHHNDVTKEEMNYKALESPVQGPDRSRLTLFVEGGHPILLLKLLKAVVSAQEGSIKEPMDEA